MNDPSPVLHTIYLHCIGGGCMPWSLCTISRISTPTSFRVVVISHIVARCRYRKCTRHSWWRQRPIADRERVAMIQQIHWNTPSQLVYGCRTKSSPKWAKLTKPGIGVSQLRVAHVHSFSGGRLEPPSILKRYNLLAARVPLDRRRGRGPCALHKLQNPVATPLNPLYSTDFKCASVTLLC